MKAMSHCDRLELERIQHAVAVRLAQDHGIYLQHPRLLLQELALSTDKVVAIFAGMTAGEKLDHQTYVLSIDTPLSWWQHFKQDYFPSWLLDRFPVLYKTHRREVSYILKEVYPRFHKYFPDAAGASFKVLDLVTPSDYGCDD